METVSLPTFEMFNGNNQLYTRELPKIIIQGTINDVALAHLERQTGLSFTKDHWGHLHAQPISFDQYMRVFLTYNFKTRYYNNNNYRNTLVLRFDHHHGFDVTSICKACVDHNHIHVPDLGADDRLAC